jgi:hypothetical protein
MFVHPVLKPSFGRSPHARAIYPLSPENAPGPCSVAAVNKRGALHLQPPRRVTARATVPGRLDRILRTAVTLPGESMPLERPPPAQRLADALATDTRTVDTPLCHLRHLDLWTAT